MAKAITFMMENLRKARKIFIPFAAILIVTMIFSSCAAKKDTASEGPLNELVQDSVADSEKTVDEVEFSEDVVIRIEKRGADGSEKDDETEEPASEDDESGELDTDELSDDEIEFEGALSGLDTDDEPDGDDVPDTADDSLYDSDYMNIDPFSEQFRLYDVPLPEFKQKYVIDMAQRFKIPPELIFGVMYVESRYDETAISKNGKYIGIMQISKSNLKTLKKKLGTDDLQDFNQNVEAGAYFLSYFYKKYDGNIDKVCMCYHCGEGGASVKWRNGVTQDSYCRKVRAEMERIYSAEKK